MSERECEDLSWGGRRKLKDSVRKDKRQIDSKGGCFSLPSTHVLLVGSMMGHHFPGIYFLYYLIFFLRSSFETTQMHMKSNVPFRWKIIVKWGNNVLQFELVLPAGMPTGIPKWQEGEIDAVCVIHK